MVEQLSAEHSLNAQADKTRKLKYWGLGLIGVGLVFELSPYFPETPFGDLYLLGFFGGMLLCGIGLACYAKSRGRSVAWCFGAMLYIIGPLIAIMGIIYEGKRSDKGPRVQPVKTARLAKNSMRFLVFISVLLLGVLPNIIPHTPRDKDLRWFPVLILTPGEMKETYQAHVMFNPQVDEFLKGHAQYTFLIPAGQEAQLQAQLASRPIDPHSFRVLERSNGKQILEVTLRWGMGDHAHLGVYEAKDKEVVPIRYADRSTLTLVPVFLIFGFLALVVSVLLSELIWWVVARFRSA